MASKKMEDALNKQLNAEMYSSYLYVAMAAYFEANNLEGFAGWMKAQAQEELMHAQKFYAYINDVGGRVVLEAIDKPPTDFESPLNIFEMTLEHEKKVTHGIHSLVNLAREEADYATEAFLQWFVTEQVEEEATADKLVQDLRLVGSAPQGLFMMDRQLGARQPASAPADE